MITTCGSNCLGSVTGSSPLAASTQISQPWQAVSNGLSPSLTMSWSPVTKIQIRSPLYSMIHPLLDGMCWDHEIFLPESQLPGPTLLVSKLYRAKVFPVFSFGSRLYSLCRETCGVYD
jgi:hypothetical protein